MMDISVEPSGISRQKDGFERFVHSPLLPDAPAISIY